MKKIILMLGIVAINACCMQAQNAVSDRDRKFVTEAIEGNLMEIKFGELAQTNGSSAEVKDFGTHMITDHTKANAEIITLATTKGINMPTTMCKKAQMAYDKLSKKTGKEFDKTFMKCMIKHHKKDICKFKKEAKKGSDPDLKAWAKNMLPILQHHKEMAQETCKSLHDKE